MSPHAFLRWVRNHATNSAFLIDARVVRLCRPFGKIAAVAISELHRLGWLGRGPQQAASSSSCSSPSHCGAGPRYRNCRKRKGAGDAATLFNRLVGGARRNRGCSGTEALPEDRNLPGLWYAPGRGRTHWIDSGSMNFAAFYLPQGMFRQFNGSFVNGSFASLTGQRCLKSLAHSTPPMLP